MLGPLFFKLRLEIFNREAPGIEPGLLGGRINFHQQLTFLDHVTDLRVDLLDLPGSLGADVDIAPGLQGAQRGDTAFDVTPGDLHGGELVPTGRDHLPGGDGDKGNQTQGCKQGASGVSGTFHAGFRPMEIDPSCALPVSIRR